VRPVWADIDLAAVSANVRTLAEIAGTPVCAVVKADGYGHGAVPVARAALDGGAQMLAVALVAEGTELRDAHIACPVLVLSQASPGEFADLVRHDLDATVYTASGVDALRAAARSAERGSDRPVGVHLKVDTGMHRVGARPDEALDLARCIDEAPELALRSVFTHCAVADEPEDPYTAAQLARFHEVVERIEADGIEVPVRHAANTAAALAFPEARLDLVRCGIGVYGIAPGDALAGAAPLRPALSLRAEVSHVKRLRAGERVSYGLRYTAPADTTLATVPLGYADGVTRSLGARGGEVLVGGRRRPIAGTVTMDQFLVDCGDLDVAVGDEVVLIGSQGDETLAVDEWARRVGTISYEIVCGISTRVRRRYR